MVSNGFVKAFWAATHFDATFIMCCDICYVRPAVCVYVSVSVCMCEGPSGASCDDDCYVNGCGCAVESKACGKGQGCARESVQVLGFNCGRDSEGAHLNACSG